jgi:N-acetylglutamate synthase-like GNAT family acetyltransferase
MSLTIRSIEYTDTEACGKIGYQAHKVISSSHGYPSEQPSVEFAVGMIKTFLASPNSWGVLAEREGRILGSIFLHVFPPSPIAAIGPLTVDPSAEGGIGKVLMDAVLDQARKRQYDRVRLVQSPSHIRSFVLYTKCGFTLREPFFSCKEIQLEEAATIQKVMMSVQFVLTIFLHATNFAPPSMDFPEKWSFVKP